MFDLLEEHHQFCWIKIETVNNSVPHDEPPEVVLFLEFGVDIKQYLVDKMIALYTVFRKGVISSPCFSFFLQALYFHFLPVNKFCRGK